MDRSRVEVPGALMGYLHVCDWCGKTSDDIKGWRIMKIPSGPRDVTLCSGECVILWEQDRAVKVAAAEAAGTKRRRWWQQQEGS